MTVTVALCVAVPPVPVQTRVYVMVTVGETDCVPDIAFVPVHPADAVQEVAFVELHVKVEAEPEVIDVGLAEMETVGAGATLETVTLTVAAVPIFPAASRAVAVKVCEPLVAVVEFQVVEYGEVVSSLPRFTPSSLN